MLNKKLVEYQIMANDSPSRYRSNTPSFPVILDYDGFEQNTDGHNTQKFTMQGYYFYHKPNSVQDLLCYYYCYYCYYYYYYYRYYC